MNWKALIIVALFLIAFGFFVGQSCSSNESITNIDKAISKSQKNYEKLAEEMKALGDSLTALSIQRTENKNYYTYETYKIDSLIQLDSLIVNAIIRARIDRLYQLPGFFIIPTDSGRAINGSESTTGW